MRAALEALCGAGDAYEAPIMQLVQVVEGGERARMSKRKGQFVTLDELIDDIGVDAARFFMLQRSHDTALDLDLDLARKQSQDNPVYYVQYAHARIASILRKAVAEAGIRRARTERSTQAAIAEAVRGRMDGPGPSRRGRARAGACSSSRARWPTRPSGARRIGSAPTPTATAADFHAFYRDCQVVGVEPPTQAARLGSLRGHQARHRGAAWT